MLDTYNNPIFNGNSPYYEDMWDDEDYASGEANELDDWETNELFQD